MAEMMFSISQTLGEPSEDAPWANGRRNLLKAAAEKLPDFNEVVRLMLREKSIGRSVPQIGSSQKGKNAASAVDSISGNSSVLHEAVSRLMWHYQRYIVNRASETHVSMKHITLPVISGDYEALADSSKSNPLLMLSQVHGLRLLGEMESCDWTVKIGECFICPFVDLELTDLDRKQDCGLPDHAPTRDDSTSCCPGSLRRTVNAIPLQERYIRARRWRNRAVALLHTSPDEGAKHIRPGRDASFGRGPGLPSVV